MQARQGAVTAMEMVRMRAGRVMMRLAPKRMAVAGRCLGRNWRSVGVIRERDVLNRDGLAGSMMRKGLLVAGSGFFVLLLL